MFVLKIFLVLFFLSCTNSNIPLIGTNKKPQEQLQAPPRIPNQPTKLPNTPYNPPAKPDNFRPLPPPLPAPYLPPVMPVPPPDNFLPRVLPTSSPTSEPTIIPSNAPSAEPSAAPTSAPRSDNGVVQWTVYMIANQDTKNHPTDEQRFEMTSSSGELLASGVVDEFSIINGESAAGSDLNLAGVDPIGGSPFVLRTKTKYITAAAAALSGDQQIGFSVFVPTNDSAPYSGKAARKNVPNAGHSNGISTIQNATGTARFQNGNILIKNISGAGEYGSCPGSEGIPCVAGVHPSRMYAFASPSRIGRDPGSPLVIDFSKDKKLKLTSIDDKKFSVKFDLKNTGTAGKVGWVGKKAGLLCIDLDGDGKIKNGRQLFGEYSFRIDGQKKKFDNGFIALSQYDTENKGYIDQSNPVFKKLKIWFDENHNGVSEPGELIELSKLGIKKIRLDYQTLLHPLRVAGNIIPVKSIVEMNDGSLLAIYDVFFQIDYRRSLAQIQKTFLEQAVLGGL